VHLIGVHARSGGEINPPAKPLSLPPDRSDETCAFRSSPSVYILSLSTATRERERERERERQLGTERNGRGREDARRAAADTMPPFYRKSQSPSRRLKVPPWKNITSPLRGANKCNSVSALARSRSLSSPSRSRFLAASRFLPGTRAGDYAQASLISRESGLIFYPTNPTQRVCMCVLRGQEEFNQERTYVALNVTVTLDTEDESSDLLEQPYCWRRCLLKNRARRIETTRRADGTLHRDGDAIYFLTPVIASWK